MSEKKRRNTSIDPKKGIKKLKVDVEDDDDVVYLPTSSTAAENIQKKQKTKSIDQKKVIKKIKGGGIDDDDVVYLPTSSTTAENFQNKRKTKSIDPKKVIKKLKVDVEDDDDVVCFPTSSTAAKNFQKEKDKGRKRAPAKDVDNKETMFDLSRVKHEKLAEIEGIDLQTSLNLVQLFEQDNTIPFIARYRKHLTKGMDAEKLRQVKDTLDGVEKVEAKAESLLKTIAKEGPVDPALCTRIINAKTLDEIEFIAAPYKKENKGTLAARARQDGLEDCAMALLNGCGKIFLKDSIKSGMDEKKVAAGIQHIISDVVAKDENILKLLERLRNEEIILIQCTEKKANTSVQTGKFDNYKNFSMDIRCVKDHQVLAINRGVAQKVLSVKLTISDTFWEKVKKACREKWLSTGEMYEDRSKIFDKAVDDAIHRLLTPLVNRQIMNQLTKTAEKSAISVFLENLKKLLLSPPLRGKVVLAIDPGISHGCKVAIVSPVGQVLDTGIIYLNQRNQRSLTEETLCNWIKTHNCETIALGNGTFCRETEEFIGNMIHSGKFLPLDVKYTIVDEQGVSIYSCSAAAAEEFPDMNPNLISAVSLARRLQDPIAELVKVEPKHLGVGMYQHDVPEKKLTAALDEVVSECVSFVGVDLNTASVHLLRYIAGLTKSRAAAIAEWRQKHGPFQNRDQLLKLKGIGPKTFCQCGGFVKIFPSTACPSQEKKKSELKLLNPLDKTEIHPEDYQLTLKLLKKFKLCVDDIGSSGFIRELTNHMNEIDLHSLAAEFNVPELQIAQICEALGKPADFDMRSISQTPLFRRGVTKLESLEIGQTLTGVVRNVVPFGAFVDIGVGISGLVHSSKLGFDRTKWVQLGDKVEVVVLSVDVHNKRIGLKVSKILN